MPSRLLGIDVGTGGTRAVLIDNTGAVIAARTSEHKPFASPKTGWAEQDPHDWWRATCEAIRELLEESATPASEIAAVGFSGQMHGAVLLDAAGDVLRPALIWCDQRTADEAAELTAQLGESQIIAWTCNPALTNFTLTKLLWVRKHEPHLFERFHTLLASQGLRSLSPLRPVRNGHGRRLRHAPARCDQSSLVHRNGERHRARSRIAFLRFSSRPMFAPRFQRLVPTRLVCSKVHRSSPVQATRPQALLAWASSGPVLCMPPSAPRAWCLPRPIGRRSIPRAGCTLSVTRFPDAGTSWA